jgi:transposase
MTIQSRLPLHPAEAIVINDTVSFIDDGMTVGYFAAGIPLFLHAREDVVGRRVAAAQIIALGLATPTELSVGLRVGRTTLYRQQQRFKSQGVEGLADEKHGPKGPHKHTEQLISQAQGLLDAGKSNRAVAEEVGVSEGTIRHAVRRGWLRVARVAPAQLDATAEASQPQQRTAEDAAAPLGVGTTRVIERVLAATGKLQQAEPRFEASRSVSNAGALIALPALLSLGLLEVGEKVYGELRNGFYGLRSTLMCLAFMALLRIRNPDRMQFEAPGELGALLGLDRAPEAKTIRRKLLELTERKLAHRFSAGLAERWVHQASRAVGLLYVDGHVRAYHGEKHRLSKTHVARRRLCMAATTDYWINDKSAEPLFFITGEANERLIATLKERILPEVRRLVGTRRVTVVFDREGWSPKLFAELYGAGFDVMTYRRGRYRKWPLGAFAVVKGRVDGRRVSYQLAEKTVRIHHGFKMREVRRLRADGTRQTAVLTTCWKMPILQVAWRMFARWRQENFFRYMREHFALDALASRRVQPVDPSRSIPNPKRRKLEKRLASMRLQLQKLQTEYGARALDNEESRRPTARGFKIANGRLGTEIRALNERCRLLKERISALPKRVAVGEVEGETMVSLDPEVKHLTDTIKMVAYRAETTLVGVLGPAYARTEEEGRALVREILRASADILPDEGAGVLRVRLHGLANPRSNEAVKHLCEQLNELDITYPATALRLRYEPGFVPSISATGQES